MKELSIPIDRSVFPLTKFHVLIGDIDCTISPGQAKRIKIEKEGEHQMRVASYWAITKKVVSLNQNSRISIKSTIPDNYYLTGMPTVILLSVLAFFGMVDILVLSSVILIYFMPLAFYSFINSKKYFKIEVRDE